MLDGDWPIVLVLQLDTVHGLVFTIILLLQAMMFARVLIWWLYLLRIV